MLQKLEEEINKSNLAEELLRKSQDELINAQKQFEIEILSQRKLADLYKQSFDEANTKVLQIEGLFLFFFLSLLFFLNLNKQIQKYKRENETIATKF